MEESIDGHSVYGTDGIHLRHMHMKLPRDSWNKLGPIVCSQKVETIGTLWTDGLPEPWDPEIREERALKD